MMGTQTVRVGEIEWHYRRRGSGPVLLLVHGFPLDHTMWQNQLDELPDVADIVAVDLRGFGSSQVVPGTVFMEDYADDLSKLLIALEITEPVVFCGLSMGGYIGWQFWQNHRQQLAGLILCDTRADDDDPETARGRRITAERVLRDGAGVLADMMIEKLFGSRTRSQGSRLMADTELVIRGTAPESIAGALRGMAERIDMQPRLGEIDVPTLLVCGTEDAISPPAEMRGIAHAIPDGQFVEIEHAGHMAPLENPRDTNEALRRFLVGFHRQP